MFSKLFTESKKFSNLFISWEVQGITTCKILQVVNKRAFVGLVFISG